MLPLLLLLESSIGRIGVIAGLLFSLYGRLALFDLLEAC